MSDPRTIRPRLRRVLILLALAGLFAGRGGALAGDPPSDLEVKAVFLLNFVRMVDWTQLPGEVNPATLSICSLQNSEFASAVRSAVAGKTAGNRALEVRIEPIPDRRRCRVLIVDAAQYPAVRHTLSALGEDAPVLTVGNGAGFLDLGGMFELSVANRRVYFDANVDAIRRSGLNVSARLLQLARNVRKGGNVR